MVVGNSGDGKGTVVKIIESKYSLMEVLIARSRIVHERT